MADQTVEMEVGDAHRGFRKVANPDAGCEFAALLEFPEQAFELRDQRSGYRCQKVAAVAPAADAAGQNLAPDLAIDEHEGAIEQQPKKGLDGDVEVFRQVVEKFLPLGPPFLDMGSRMPCSSPSLDPK